MLSVDEARQLILQTCVRLRPTRVSLAEACGLVLAEDALADRDSPPHDKAMMDGYAVVSSDRALRRRVLEEVTAGLVPTQRVTPGTATRIMTGAPVPEGADAVVPVEKTSIVEEGVVEPAWIDPPPGKHIMPRGTVMHAGDVVLPAGSRLLPASVGLLAEIGLASVPVVPRVRVAILATGNELVDADQVPPPGAIRNSNGPMLAAAAAADGHTVTLLPIGRDDRDQLAALVAEGLTHDVLLVTGGVSMGSLDLVPGVLEAAGVSQVLHKVAVKPGKPLWFGTRGSSAGPPRLVFGLPGNPASTLVGYYVFVRAALDALAGRPSVDLTCPATLLDDFPTAGDRELFHPALVTPADTGWQVCPVAWRGSPDLRGLAAANGLLRVAAHSAPLRAGDAVNVAFFGI